MGGRLDVALISSDCLGVRTARDEPFTGSDEVAGLDDDGPDGSCIVSVCGWHGKNLGIGGPRSAAAQSQFWIVILSRDVRATNFCIPRKHLNLKPQPRPAPEDAIELPDHIGVLSCHLPPRPRIRHQLMSIVCRTRSERWIWSLTD